MRYKILAAVAAVASLAGLCVTVALPAAADDGAPKPIAGNLSFVRVYYNAVGADTMANRWQERIYLQNKTGGRLDISGVTVHDTYTNAAGEHTNAKTFPPGTVLEVDGTAVVTSAPAPAGKADGSADRSGAKWYYMDFKRGYHGHWLNNGGDTIFVEDSSRKEIAKFSYSWDSGYYVL